MRKTIYIPLLALAGFAISMIGCKKSDPYTLITPPPLVHFTGAKLQNYTMNAVNPPVYNVGIGTTDVATTDRHVKVNIVSTTGAVQGTHYTVGSTDIVIPAGQTLGNLSIQGIFAPYTTGRKDTLVITLAAPSITPAKFSDTVKLVLRGPCFDSDIVFSGLLGSYTRTFENGSYGPYTTTIVSPITVNATTTKATITNVYDSGISAQATFTYTTVGSFTVIMSDQSTGLTSGGLPLFIRQTPSTTGLFTYCTPFFTLYLDLYTSAGLYDRWVMTMRR